MAAFGVSGTFTVSREGSVVSVVGGLEIDGANLSIACTPTAISESDDAFVLALIDSRAAGSTCAARITIDRYAVRGGIARHHQRVSRAATIAAAPDVDAFGEPFAIPDGEVSVLTITAVGDETEVIA